MPHTIVSAHCRAQFWIAAQEIELFWHLYQLFTIFNCPSSFIPTLVSQCVSGDQTITSFLSYNLFLPTIPNHATLPHTIHNASHNCERTLPHTMLRTMPLNFLNCRTGNRIILTHIAAHNSQWLTQLWAHIAAHNSELPRRKWNYFALLQNLHNFSLSSVTPRAVNIYLQHVECVFEFKWLCFTVTNSISHDPSSICCTTQRQVLQQHQLRFTAEVSHFCFQAFLGFGKVHQSWRSLSIRGV